MLIKSILFVILNFLMVPNVYSGEFYKCIDANGKTIFSDKQCAGNAEKFNIKKDKDYEADSDNTGTAYTGSSYSSGRTIHTGPRGGRYYYNSSGNKTYVKGK